MGFKGFMGFMRFTGLFAAAVLTTVVVRAELVEPRARVNLSDEKGELEYVQAFVRAGAR